MCGVRPRLTGCTPLCQCGHHPTVPTRIGARNREQATSLSPQGERCRAKIRVEVP